MDRLDLALTAVLWLLTPWAGQETVAVTDGPLHALAVENHPSPLALPPPGEAAAKR